MKTIAAILVETGRPLEIVELGLPALKAGQVLVEVAYSGVCHTQVLEARGHRGEDRFLPHCLGHEGSGRVLETGPEVTKVKVGDTVVLTWLKGHGADVRGSTYDLGGRTVNAGAITTFMSHAVVSENRLVPLPPAMGVREGALLGCAIPTGFGAVLNNLAASEGRSLAVFGVGGVGLSALMAGAAIGCKPLVAIDINPAKLEAARRHGATHTIDAAGNPAKALAEICPSGVDFAIEATGRPDVMTLAFESVRMKGGHCAIVGNPPHGQKFLVDPMQLIVGKRVTGSWGGETEPDRDVPRFVDIITRKKVDVGTMLSAPYPLEKINDALNDLEHGVVTRPLIEIKPFSR